MSKNTCGNCIHYDNGCSEMVSGKKTLIKVKVTPETVCPIESFVKKPDELELDKPIEMIGLRDFGRLVNISLASVQEAIDSGRITAVAHVMRGRKSVRQLYKEEALAQWNATRTAANNNRAGELPADKQSESKPDSEETPGRAKTQAEAKLAELRCQKLEMEIAETDGRLHDGAQIAAVWAAILSNFRSNMRAIPSKVAPKLVAIPNLTAAMAQEMMLDEIDQVLSELASGKFLTSANANYADCDDDE